MRDFTGLKVWQRAHCMTLAVYRESRTFPNDERYGLTRDLRRAALSVPSNIAEGCGRETERELARFMSIAAGSASEVEYQLLLARDLGYLAEAIHRDLNTAVTEVRRMLSSFMKKLKTDAREN